MRVQLGSCHGWGRATPGSDGPRGGLGTALQGPGGGSERSRSITIPCADGAALPVVVWAKNRLSFSVPENLGLLEIPGWVSVTYVGQVLPGVIQVEVKEASGHRTPLNILMTNIKGIDDLKNHLFNWGTQYYIAARFGAVEWLSPVCANLFHHAIEMYLKGYLCVRSVKNLQTEFGHDLEKIWEEFKATQEVPDAMLCRFDPTICDLNKYEDIRYPDKLLMYGMIVQINFEPPSLSGLDQDSLTSVPRYGLVVDKIDSLVKVIFEKAKLNHKYFSLGLKESTRN